MSTNIPRVSPESVRERMANGDGTWLVCAYADAAKCEARHLPGAIPFTDLEARTPPLDQPLVFYCA